MVFFFAKKECRRRRQEITVQLRKVKFCFAVYYSLTKHNNDLFCE
jgi:hypothetical protein